MFTAVTYNEVVFFYVYIYIYIYIPALRPKSQWKPPTEHPCVELFLSRLEKELFSFLPGKPQSYNLTKEEWKAMRNLAGSVNYF